MTQTSSSAVRPKRIVGYSDELSVLAGESVTFRVSCDPAVSEYDAAIVRMHSGDPREGASGLRFTEIVPLGTFPGRLQPIMPGSYGLAEIGAALTEDVVTLAVLAQPTLSGPTRQVLLAAAADGGAGDIVLLLDDRLHAAVEIGGRSVVSGEQPLTLGDWQELVVVIDRDAGSVRLAHRSVSALEWASVEASFVPASGDEGSWTMAFGARIAGSAGQPSDPYTGRLERPLLAGALSSKRAGELLLCEVAELRSAPGLIAAWDFADGISTWDIRDVGPAGLHGSLHNLPMRAVRGVHWQPGTTDWQVAPREYAAIHFLADAIEDCGWQADFQAVVPPGTTSGFYAARLVSGEDTDFVPFFVRPATDSDRARVLLVAPSATYSAYSNSRFWWESPVQEAVQDRLVELGQEEQYLLVHPEAGLSSYDCHLDGTDVCYVSRRRPNLNMRPGHVRAEGYTCDLYLVDWMEHEGYQFDVVTDEDLHSDGVELLAKYPVVLTGTHPEYMSAKIFDAFDQYTDNGGRLLYLGGNGFFMNINFDQTRPWVMENRRVDLWERDEQTQQAESLNSTDGLRGGRLHKIGRSALRGVGVESATMGFDHSYPVVRTEESRDTRAEFVFTGLQSEVLGDFGLLGGGAIGQEWDNAAGYDRPPGHLIVASTADMSLVPALFGASKQDYRGDVVLLFKGAGCVFSTGSMAWCGSLSHDGYRNDVATMTRNVIDRFLDAQTLVGTSGNGQN